MASKVALNLRIDPALAKRLEGAAKSYKVSKTALVEAALDAFLPLRGGEDGESSTQSSTQSFVQTSTHLHRSFESALSLALEEHANRLESAMNRNAETISKALEKCVDICVDQSSQAAQKRPLSTHSSTQPTQPSTQVSTQTSIQPSSDKPKKTKLTGGRPGRVIVLDGVEATLSEHLRRLLPGVSEEKRRTAVRGIRKAINRGDDPAMAVARFVARYRAGAG